MARLAVAFVGFVCLVAQPAAAQVATAPAQAYAVVGQTALAANRAGLSGVAIDPLGQPLPNLGVQARNLLNGQIAGSTATSATGRFSIPGLPPASYVVELLDRGGQIVGTSSFVSAAAGTFATVTVTATTGTLSAIATATGLAGTLSTAAESMKYAATAAGFAGVVVPANIQTASASR